jgi:hypothetical protein
MDYTDPTDRRLRDEPTIPLSPEEIQLAAAQYQASVLSQLNAFLLGTPSPLQLPNHEKENPRFN